MSLLKRFEVWFLLLLGTAAAIWVLMDRPAVEGDPQAIDASVPTTEPAIRILRCSLERDYGNARLDIELRYRNDSPRPLILQPPEVKLLTDNGGEVSPFILPMEKPPQIAERTSQTVRLRYWLDNVQLRGALFLQVRDHRAEVKSAAPLNLESLTNQQAKTWPGSIR